jgi:two-component system sensor kinase FixL
MANELIESSGFRWLFNAVADALLLIDDDGRIALSNPAAQQLFGYASDDLEGQMVELLMPPRFRSRHHVLRQGFLRDHRQRPAGAGLELIAQSQDGREIPVEISLSPVLAGSDTFTLASIHDITPRKTRERDVLGRRREMESMQKQHVASQTAAVIAHELNQPLLAIASYSKSALMMLESSRPDPERLRQAISGCERQAQRAGQSIREMLRFLNMNEFPSETFDLAQELKVALDTACAEHPGSVETRLQVQSDLPQVCANRTHVHKALLNLMHNGIEAMQESAVSHPTLIVRAEAQKGKPFALVSISDNGPGLSSENLKSLFDPFFTTKSSGIGMGLSVSRSLVEANGGQLWAESREGPGAIFHLTVPFAE